jgi:transcriptional regulator with XRE-family HTH domain
MALCARSSPCGSLPKPCHRRLLLENLFKSSRIQLLRKTFSAVQKNTSKINEGEALMNNYGVILRKLRELKQYQVKQAAQIIRRSAGWLSEIENGRGAARIGLEEFERIVSVYDGQAYRKQFPAWVAHAHRYATPKQPLGFDGAILRHLRGKAKLSLATAAEKVGISATHLCNLEKGKRSISPELRDGLMQVYGYSPSSFKNFATEDKRGKNIPVRYKLEILLNQLDGPRIEKVFAFALEGIGNQTQQPTN